MGESRGKSTLKIIGFIIIFPLLVALFGGWELSRVGASVDGFSPEEIELQQAIHDLGEIKKKDPIAKIKDNEGKSHSVDYVLGELTQEYNRLREFSFLPLRPLAFSTIGFGVASALVGGYGMFSIWSMGRRALRSRADLLKSFQGGRRLLPWLLALVGVLTIGAVVCILLYEGLSFLPDAINSQRGSKLLVFGAIGAVALVIIAFALVKNVVKSSRTVFQREPSQLLGRSISEADAPEVWNFVRRVAEKVKAAMPNTIIAGLDQGFFVTENPVVLANGEAIPPGRVLYLPLPYMAFMSESETAAVIGHELGHFIGEDTEYSLRFAPIYASVVQNLNAVDASGKGDGKTVFKHVILLGEYFLSSFDLAVQHWSRIREFAADATGASVTSGRDIVSSLLRISVLEPHINAVLSEYWDKGGRVTGGILQAVRQRVKDQGFSDPAQHLEQAQAHPTDSHPSLRQRMEALRIAPSSDLMEAARNRQDSGLLVRLGLEAAPRSQDDDSEIQASASSQSLRTVAAPSISQALETELTQKARENYEEEIQTLRKIEAAGAETRVLHEGISLLIIIMIAITGGVLYVAVGGTLRELGLSDFMGAIPEKPYTLVGLITHPDQMSYLLLGAWVLGLFCLTRLLRFFLRKGKPVMTLTTKGILVGTPTTEIPWAVFEDYQVVSTSHNGMSTGLVLSLFLKEGYTPPAISGDGRVKHRKKYRKMKNRIAIKLFTVKGLSPDDFATLIGTYLAAGRARDELKRRA